MSGRGRFARQRQFASLEDDRPATSGSRGFSQPSRVCGTMPHRAGTTVTVSAVSAVDRSDDRSSSGRGYHIDCRSLRNHDGRHDNDRRDERYHNHGKSGPPKQGRDAYEYHRRGGYGQGGGRYGGRRNHGNRVDRPTKAVLHHCKLCDVYCSSDKFLQSHIQGKKHRMNEKRAESKRKRQLAEAEDKERTVERERKRQRTEDRKGSAVAVQYRTRPRLSRNVKTKLDPMEKLKETTVQWINTSFARLDDQLHINYNQFLSAESDAELLKYQEYIRSHLFLMSKLKLWLHLALVHKLDESEAEATKSVVSDYIDTHQDSKWHGPGAFYRIFSQARGCLCVFDDNFRVNETMEVVFEWISDVAEKLRRLIVDHQSDLKKIFDRSPERDSISWFEFDTNRFKRYILSHTYNIQMLETIRGLIWSHELEVKEIEKVKSDVNEYFGKYNYIRSSNDPRGIYRKLGIDELNDYALEATTAGNLKIALASMGSWKKTAEVLLPNSDWLYWTCADAARFLGNAGWLRAGDNFRVNERKREAFIGILKIIHSGSISSETQYATMLRHIDILGDDLGYSTTAQNTFVKTTLLSLGRLGLPSEIALRVAGHAVVENVCSLLESFAASSDLITMPGVQLSNI